MSSIDNKQVKSITIGGKSIKQFTIEGNIFTISHIIDTSITAQEMATFVTNHTTWVGNMATIDTTTKIKGLNIEYSKSTGITDGETIITTVKYDPNIGTINKEAKDFVTPNIAVLNPSRTITEQQVKDYIDSHITWHGNSGLLNTGDFWKVDLPLTLNVDDKNITKGVDVEYTITPVAGFTVNGGTEFKVTYNIPLVVTGEDIVNDVIKYIVDNAKTFTPTVISGFNVIYLDGYPAMTDDDYNKIEAFIASDSPKYNAKVIATYNGIDYDYSTTTPIALSKSVYNNDLNIVYESRTHSVYINIFRKRGSSDSHENKPGITIQFVGGYSKIDVQSIMKA